jgi:hypothetical protein
MNRRPLSALAALSLLGVTATLATSDAPAHPSTLKESLVGTWEISKVTNEYEDGLETSPYGAGVSGRYIFGRDGAFSQIVIGEPRAELKGDDIRRPDALIVVNLGHYTVDETSKIVSYRIEHAGYSPRIGGERSMTVEFDGDTGFFSTPKLKDQYGVFLLQAKARRVE